jgi:GNAT superfamily N-acetyltransferase
VTDLIVRPVDLAETRPLRQSVLRPNLALAELARHEPPGAFAAGGFIQRELVAVGLIGREGPPGSWRLRGMATAPGKRGCGAGTGVLELLLNHAVAQGATRIWCNARTPARTFYERAGLSVISQEFELEEIGAHIVMELRLPRAS